MEIVVKVMAKDERIDPEIGFNKYYVNEEWNRGFYFTRLQGKTFAF